ncbi:protein TolR [Facilibium subflavum]|uniref:protein TolR n=1 Tax=Facilibium subflavum TaxID=2219058 RepID=UPI0013C34722|nr:protein TolR [Facilibium subflavum]
MRQRQSRRTKRKAMVEINVVPYIDVMLVLLIIFMITAPMLTQGVKVSLPQASAKKISPTQNKPFIVTVNANGQYFTNQSSNETVSADALKMAVMQALQNNPKKQVYVKGDKNASYGQVVAAMVLLQKAGVDNVGLVTDDPQKT